MINWQQKEVKTSYTFNSVLKKCVWTNNSILREHK